MIEGNRLHLYLLSKQIIVVPAHAVAISLLTTPHIITLADPPAATSGRRRLLTVVVSTDPEFQDPLQSMLRDHL